MADIDETIKNLDPKRTVIITYQVIVDVETAKHADLVLRQHLRNLADNTPNLTADEVSDVFTAEAIRLKQPKW